MKRITLIDDMLFCCLTDEQKMELQQDIEQMSYKSTYRYQERLIKEKTGYRCSVCGAFYPYLGIRHTNQMIALEAFSKIQGKVAKYKKAATIFCGNYYYAYNKNTLLKYELDETSVMQQTDMIPIMKDVYHVTISLDEKYIATETVKGTVCIVDLETKQTIAKKQKCKVMNSFVFHKDGQKLYYFLEHAIWCWSFLEGKTEQIWKAPEEWVMPDEEGRTYYVGCTKSFYNQEKDAYMFQCNSRAIVYVIAIEENGTVDCIKLSNTDSLCKLEYQEKSDQYTLYSDGKVNIYDGEFRLQDSLPCPIFLQYNDGGGRLPITYFENHVYRTFLSSDGKWVLFDYFNYIILMRRSNYEIIYCVFSYSGRTAMNMGFWDNDHFWYTWGATTYVQEIGEEQQ